MRRTALSWIDGARSVECCASQLKGQLSLDGTNKQRVLGE